MYTSFNTMTDSIGDLVLEDRVHRLVYVDPKVFDLEIKEIFGRTWVFVGHESQIANSGDFVTTYIGRQPVIMTRDTGGQVFVLFNRCAHRGAIVCREERGTSDRLKCLYHGWTYSNSGRLITVPSRDAYGPDFNADELGLGRVPRVESYRGFVFGCLSSDIEPLETHLGRAKPYLDLILNRAPEGEIEVDKGIQKFAYRGNWKLHLENWCDGYHAAYTHEAMYQQIRSRTGKKLVRGDARAENVDLGHGHCMIDYSAAKDGPNIVGGSMEAVGRGGTGQIDPAHLAALQKRLGAVEAERVLTKSNMNIIMYPNLLFRSDAQGFHVIRPIKVDYTEVFYYPYRLKGAPDALNDWFVRRSGPNAVHPVQNDDTEAYECIQDGLAAESMEWVLFSRGMHRERVEPNGEIRGLASDEVGHRGQHREYKRLMLRGE